MSVAASDPAERFERFRRFHYHHEQLALSIDLSRLRYEEIELGLRNGPMSDRLRRALEQMRELEAGAIANPDEKRQVGHYWLRAPELAPDPAIRRQIEQALGQVEAVARQVHTGAVRPQRARAFERVVVIGIGGSALGPQLVSDALGGPGDPLRLHFVDNTDPDGIDRLLDSIGPSLAATLCVVTSKSGGTKETRNGMLEVQHAFVQAGLDFGPHAIAITKEGSELDRTARELGFLARVPMWDWVGGRTSVTCAVGLLPAALQGLDVRALLRGARLMDEATRIVDAGSNPAALLAAAWYCVGEGRGAKDMVVIPYKDRLGLLSRYLQQLIMESLGKRFDLEGRRVDQGIAVYGNKGSTDQHAYVQQLLEGLDCAFVTLVEVLRDRAAGRASIEVEPGVTTGDYLSGFLQGTRRALNERGRESLTITIERVDAQSVGALIALYERTVGIYAMLANINAYHQPAVEAGKRAAAQVIELQGRLRGILRDNAGTSFSVHELGELAGTDDLEAIFWVLRHLAANPERGIQRTLEAGEPPWEARFEWTGAQGPSGAG